MKITMDALIQFSIPVKGLGYGEHEYRFNIDRSFFKEFEHSPIRNGAFDVHLIFDKRPEMFDLNFDFKGTAKAACDRCLATVDLPVEGQNRLLVKFGEERDEDADVIFVSPEISSLNVAKFVYEYICLAMPLINVFDCESLPEPPCDQKMLAYLDQQENDENDNDIDPIWDELKNALK